MIRSLRSISLAVSVWAACPAFGQVVLAPGHADGLYRAGEKAVWTVKPVPQSRATDATWTARKNGAGSPFRAGTVDLSSGSATIACIGR